MIGFLPLAAYRVCWSDTRRENASIFAHTVLCLHLGQLTNDPTKSFDSIIGISEVFFVLFEWVAQFLRQDIESRALTSNYANSIDSTAHFREIRRNKLLLCLRHFDRLTDALTLYGLKRQMETSLCLICALSMCPSIHPSIGTHPCHAEMRKHFVQQSILEMISEVWQICLAQHHCIKTQNGSQSGLDEHFQSPNTGILINL